MGKLAFMPGRIVHTNEVLALLGDNWFADVTAKEAAEIVARRQEGKITG
jgi:unconventional prefoldin RPB5 interactor 1